MRDDEGRLSSSHEGIHELSRPEGSDLTAMEDIPSTGKDWNDQLEAVAPPLFFLLPYGVKASKHSGLSPHGTVHYATLVSW